MDRRRVTRSEKLLMSSGFGSEVLSSLCLRISCTTHEGRSAMTEASTYLRARSVCSCEKGRRVGRGVEGCKVGL